MSEFRKLIDQAVANGLQELLLRPCAPMGSWQAIAKYKDRLNDPWDVGVSTDLATALVESLTPKTPPKDDGDIFA